MNNRIKKVASYASTVLLIYGLTATSAQAQVNPETDTITYTTTWAPVVTQRDTPVRRRVPEPSSILGLVAVFGLFATQGQLMKKGRFSIKFPRDMESSTKVDR
ncbi:hypothetical protein NUACC21_14280 [Scytonema sp. NUACC21]